MLRQASRLLGRTSTLTRCRAFSSEVPATATEDSTFIESWKKVIPNIEPPKTPSSFMTPRPQIPTTIPSKLTVNFVLPYASELSTTEVSFSFIVLLLFFFMAFRIWVFLEFNVNVDMVIIPATTGQMGVLPGHVPTIAELKPGVLSVHEGNDVKKYFLSSGFAFIHANSVADIIAVEAVPVDRIDSSLVQKGLAEFTQKLSSATTDLEKAEAQIGVDIHSALNFALTG
ncbi:hypothetical protein JRO89_XS13G0072500 [Xanthoceras sorbifolium]|uniref:ATP synthase F1 complex delta/epsilon subunit N-terminal domain-containing protein n=1 Tax=Xanthoceras sorbifolium TaxID=99658 RepID=A0ABQ8H723_9ROSI|nr:hypothetical protein JRO89_XS13G0072500 [Xanthoceras sorbifolium]